MATKENKHLYYLNELSDYKIASDDPDIRNWSVKDADNRVIGKVDNLLVNKEMQRVVYVEVEVDQTIIEADHDPYGTPFRDGIREFINKEGENHLIIPIGMISLNEDQKFVYSNSIDHRTFAETKRIKKGTNIERDYEVAVLESYERKNRFDDEYIGTGVSDQEISEKRREDELLREERIREEQRKEESLRREEELAFREERIKEERERDIANNNDKPFEEKFEGDLDSRRKTEYPRDNSLYERKAFDRDNYRKRK